MTNPIDVIANAIRAADGSHTMSTGQLAEVVANALTDETVIEHALQAVVGFQAGLGFPVTPAGRADLRNIVRVALRSVGGTS